MKRARLSWREWMDGSGWINSDNCDEIECADNDTAQSWLDCWMGDDCIMSDIPDRYDDYDCLWIADIVDEDDTVLDHAEMWEREYFGIA